MSAFLTGLWGKLLAGLAIAGAVLLAVLKIRQGGRDAERADQLQRNAETQRRITDADAAGPRTPDDVDRRLRDGSF